MVAVRAGFPEGFWWGAATSGHQVEGRVPESDWADWEARIGRIADGTRVGDGVGWWAGRAEEDLARAADLGHTAHRMSLEWARLEPEPGRIDEAAVDRYRAIFRAARRSGLRLVVTLNHFTLPRWAARKGGWLDRDLPERFGEHAARSARAFDGLVDRWVTLNEPGVLAFQGYVGTRWPPGRGSLLDGARALRRMAEAHAIGFRRLKEARPGVPVGIVLNLPCFSPSREASRLDRLAAGVQSWAMGGAFLRAIRSGRCLPPVGVWPTTVPGLAGAADFIGVNYYGRYVVRFDPGEPGMLFGRHVQEGSIRTEHGDWGAPWPAGLTDGLRRAGRLGVPVLVTENGVMDPTDERRPRFLVEHVEAVHDALALGVDVRGYFHWSLVDNFEWAEGWSAPFGLVAVDRATGERRIRRSAYLYERICRANGLPETLEVDQDEMH